MTSICCISDCHLGFRHRLKVQRMKDYEKAFNEALDKALSYEPILLIFGGDTFHHIRPDPKSMQTVVKRIREIADSIPCVFSIGNHEIETHLGSSYIPLLSDMHENIHVLTSESPHKYFKIDGRKLGVHGFQYIRNKKIAEEKLEEITAQISEDDINILCIHQAIEGCLEPHEISLTQLRQSAEKYDLILSGHVHKHQPITEISDITPAFYIGSTERISFNESENETGFLLFTNFDFQKPRFIQINSATMKVIKKDLGRKKPSEINKDIEKIIEENQHIACLRLTLSAEIDGDYFDVFHDWDERYPEFTILDVSLIPASGDETISLERLEINEKIFDEYFEKRGIGDKEELKSLCKELYQKHSN